MMIATLLGMATVVTPTMTGQTTDVGAASPDHSTEWSGGKARPQRNVFERTNVGATETEGIRLGGRLLSEVYGGRTLKTRKLPNGNPGNMQKAQGRPDFVAMSKVGYAAVQFEGTIGTAFQTKNYVAKLPMTTAPGEQLERALGYISNDYYGCFNVGNNYIANGVNGNADATQIWSVNWQMYNADTWMSWGSSRLDTSKAVVMYDTAYDPTQDNVVYGWMAKLPANNDNTGWYMLDMTVPSFTLIAQPQIAVRGVACSDQGQYYAIDADGKLYKVAKTTGEFTEVGNTGAKSEFRTTAAYDELSGMIFYVTVNEEGSSLYRIDPATAVGTKVYDFPQLLQLTNLYFPPREARDKAPAMPENMTVNFPQGSLTGAVEFDIPAMTYDDEPAEGRLAYKVMFTWTANSQTGEKESKEFTGSAAYGEHVAETVTLPAARRYDIKVCCTNEAGTGPWTKTITKYLGPDAPDTPYSFKGVYEDGKWKLTWGAHSTTGSNGGDIDPNTVQYILTFMPEGRQIITDPGATSYEEEMAEPKEFAKYYWTCQALLGEVKASNIRSTDKVGLGNIYPYWSDDLTSYTTSTKKDALAGFQVLDLAEKHGDWSWVSPQWINHAHWRGVDENSYLVFPKVYLYGGRYYTFNFTAGKYGSAYGNPEIRVVMGTAPTEEGLNEKVLMENTALTKVASYVNRGETGEKYSVSFMPEHDGVYYLAIHHCNKDDGSVKGNAGLYNLRVGGFEITSPIIPGAPQEVINLAATPDVDGGKSVTLSFTCPRENMGGTALMGMTRAEIKRGDLMVADVPLTGSTFKWLDSEPAMGDNSYTVTPYNNDGAGNPTTVSCYVGMTVPADVAELKAEETETKGTVKLTWTAVEKDKNGKNAQNVRYAIVRNIGGENEIVAENLKTTEYTDKVTNGEQTMAVYGVKAVTAEGVSDNWAASKTLLLGNAYNTPYVESINQGEPSSLLIAEASSSYGRWELFYDDDLAGVESVDHDNGFIGFNSQISGTQGALTTGRIAVPKELENPVFTFYYFLMPQGRNTIDVLIRTDDNPEYQHLYTFTAGPDGPGWQVCAVDMTPFLGKTVRMTLLVSTVSHTFTLIDRLALQRMADVDMNNVTIAAPAKSGLNEEVEVTVGFMNAALKPAKDYTVELMRNGEKIDEIAGEELGICERGSVTFTDVIPQTAGDFVEYEAKVVIAGDENEADNCSRKAAVVTVIKPELPVATALKADRSSETEVILQWAAPDMDTRPLETVTEGFEGHKTGDKDIAGWINLDRDGRAIGFGGSSNIKFPGLVKDESPAPWLAVNDTENNCDPAHGGNVFMGACYLTDRSTNDDWLISPELSGKAQTISLWAKSYTNFYGGDRIEVLYSMSGTDPKDFEEAFSYPYVPVAWTECKVDLPEGARHFAIRCTSIYQIMLCVDDVTYSPKGAALVAMDLLGYNIWRDGKRVNEQPVTDTNFKDNVPANEVYNYQVTAVYDRGESAACQAVSAGKYSSVGNIGVDGASVYVSDGAIVVENAGDSPVSISRVDGSVVYTGRGDACVDVSGAVYIVTVGTKAVKVMVR